MANTSTIVENFNDNSINTSVWSGNYGTVSETGGRGRIACDTGYSALGTAQAYTWDDVYCRAFPPALASATTECYLAILLYSAGQPAGTDVGFYLDQASGVFYCVSRVGYFDATASPITYNAATHAWFRILKSGGNILFQTAPDGTVWTTRRTLAAPAWLTAATDLRLSFESHRSDGINNFAEVDNVNTLGPPVADGYKVYIDWNGDGDFSDAREDVTSRILDQRTPLAVRYGRDQARALSPISAGTANGELNNVSRDYSPENAASPLAGLVQPGRRTLVQAGLNGTTYTIYSGYLDDFKVKPEVDQRSIDLSCVDALGQLNGVKVSTGLYSGIRTGDAIGLVLDAVGWPAALRDLDPGATIMPWWWLDDSDAFDAVLALVDSEGPSALVTVDGDGRIVFRDRHHRLLRSTSQTVQATWRSSGAIEPLISAPADYNHGWKEIVNDVEFDVPVRVPAGSIAPVWTNEGRVTVADGQTVQITARSGDAFLNAITPEVDTDYTLVSGAVTVTLSRTSGQSTTVSILAVGGAAIVDDLQVRGIALRTASTVVVAGEDSVSIGKYRRRSMPDTRQPVWASVYDAAAIIDLILGKRADRVPTITVSMVSANDLRRLQQLTRNLSDRVHVVEDHTGLDADCYIEQISHTVTQGGAEHRTTFGLEKVPTVITNQFLFDVAGHGFDDGRFAGTGTDNPTSMFLFDTAGQGFDQGLLAT